MADETSISDLPWTLHAKLSNEGDRLFVRDATGREVLWDDSATGDRGMDIAHAVLCVNAIHAAGITHEAIARDGECLRELVEAASSARCNAQGATALMLALRACGLGEGGTAP